MATMLGNNLIARKINCIRKVYSFPIQIILLVFIIVSMMHNINAQDKTYKIRERGPAGGWIFFDKGKYSDGWRYLEASSEDLSRDSEWDNHYQSGKILGTSIKIGSGKLNTQKIITYNGDGRYAAKLCIDYDGGGKNDWFLPSKDELNLMFANLKNFNIGEFQKWTYISSSEYNKIYVWVQSFKDGKQDYFGKTWGYGWVRAIRAF